MGFLDSPLACPDVTISHQSGFPRYVATMVGFLAASVWTQIRQISQSQPHPNYLWEDGKVLHFVNGAEIYVKSWRTSSNYYFGSLMMHLNCSRIE